MENALSLKNISFAYNNSSDSVIKNFSLDVEKGSFTTLLGASGSGKTTLLRLISGFLEPTAGKILIDGKAVNGIAPENRKIGMVFQDYALFPHMTVEQNILYGLKLKNSSLPKKQKYTKDKIQELINNTAKNLDIDMLLNRYPNELSGGQQQRVALARALVLEPNILLMDEPLSSLDTKLRQSVRTELKEIQKRLKITTIYVTHDQEEALCLSDKIAVLNEGKLMQYGTSRQIYFAPADRYTAEFIGNANFINLSGKEYMVRPEWVKISTETPASISENALYMEGTVENSEFLGGKVRYCVETEQGKINADSTSAYLEDIKIGTKVYLKFLYKKEL